MRFIVLCFMNVLLVASFQVIIPNKHLLALRGNSAVLGCEFSPDTDITNLVVTWQREEDSQVVHSFYYERDQLDRQSREYYNRTSLYITELHRGNASIRIAPVKPKDAGRYLCIVSNRKGTGKALLEFTYGALYSEPRLSIHLNSTAVSVQFETEGFPKPEVVWLGEDGQSLSHHLEVREQKDVGLFFVKSSYEAQKKGVNVTFNLKNHVLNQNLQRLVVLSYDDVSTTNHGNAALVVVSLVCVILLACVIFLIAWVQKKIKSSSSMNHYT